jgi:hypothetical protein
VRATPSRLSWTVAGGGRIDLVYESPDTVRLRGDGPALRIAAAADTLTPFGGTYFYDDPVDGSSVFTSYETGRRYRVTVLSGEAADVSGAQALGAGDRGLTVTAGPGGTWEAAVEELDSAREPYRSAAPFDRIAEAAHDAFTAFADAIAPWRSPDTPAAELAAYVLWSATVRPAGFVGRPAVLMSKHWMDKVWSWDHCFNALALAPGRPELAWDQFSLIFDHQDSGGALPDSVTHSEVLALLCRDRRVGNPALIGSSWIPREFRRTRSPVRRPVIRRAASSAPRCRLERGCRGGNCAGPGRRR